MSSPEQLPDSLVTPEADEAPEHTVRITEMGDYYFVVCDSCPYSSQNGTKYPAEAEKAKDTHSKNPQVYPSFKE